MRTNKFSFYSPWSNETYVGTIDDFVFNHKGPSPVTGSSLYVCGRTLCIADASSPSGNRTLAHFEVEDDAYYMLFNMLLTEMIQAGLEITGDTGLDVPAEMFFFK